MSLPHPAQDTYNKIDKLIKSSRYNEAFLLLKNHLQRFPALKKDLENLQGTETTYRYLLDYLFEGHEDPSRREVIDQIRDSLFHANDLVLRDTLLKDSNDVYSSTKRLFVLKQTTLQSLWEEYNSTIEEVFKENPEESSRVITVSQSRILGELFNFVWTMLGSPASDYETLSRMLEEEGLPDYMKSLLISAITLENLSYFDADSFDILLNLYDSHLSIPVKARVLVGMILISLIHSERVAGNINLRSRLMLTADDEDFKRLVNEVLINIIRTYDTQRIDNKMRNEVIPGLMKIKPDILNKMKNMASDSESFLSEGNPEWERILEESEIGDKIQEINEMQLEGSDVMVTAFSNLKGFPFFNQISNWFLPFVSGNYEFAELPFERDEMTMSRLTTVMCDSDLHSFLLSMGSMPKENSKQMLANMQNQMKEAYEAMTNSIGETDSQKLTKAIRHSLQDIYRFFKYYKKRGDFADPFATSFKASRIEPLISLLGIETANLRVIAEFYFKNKYYDEASGFFELIDRFEPGDFNVWEKLGFSHDRMQRYAEAVEWYRKAEIINPANSWLIKKLAVALKNAGNPGEALIYYEKSLAEEPENYHLLMSVGQCLLSLDRPGDALRHFYHAQYLKPDKTDTLRAVAWSELLAGNHEKAKEQYSKLLKATDVVSSDFLNAAHCALASGDLKNAGKMYAEFVNRTEKRDITALLIALRDDAETLKKLGIKTADLRLIVDKIRYDLFS